MPVLISTLQGVVSCMFKRTFMSKLANCCKGQSNKYKLIINTTEQILAFIVIDRSLIT